MTFEDYWEKNKGFIEDFAGAEKLLVKIIATDAWHTARAELISNQTDEAFQKIKENDGK